MKLSDKQIEVLKRLGAHPHGSPIKRFPGGFWSFPDVPKLERGVPAWYVPTNTIRALVQAKLVEPTEGSNHLPRWERPHALTEAGRKCAEHMAREVESTTPNQDKATARPSKWEITPDGKTDSIEYMHAVWQRGESPRFTKMRVL